MVKNHLIKMVKKKKKIKCSNNLLFRPSFLNEEDNIILNF